MGAVSLKRRCELGEQACQGCQKRVQWGLERTDIDVFGAFRPGDSFRVYRLQRKGVSLDLRQALTESHSPLGQAWLALLTQQAMGQPTFVLFSLEEGEGFVQIRYRPRQAAADVTFLAPSLDEDRGRARAWGQLLDGASVETASQGIQRVFANLPDSGEEVDVFQHAGFTLYAEEDVYRLTGSLPEMPGESDPIPRPQRPEDWPAVQKLCVAVTPQRIRQAEGGIAVTADWGKNCQRYVLPGGQGDDLLASLSVCPGRHAHWLRLLVHPDAQRRPDVQPTGPSSGAQAGGIADAMIRFGFGILAAQPSRPVYCSVRQYEGGVRVALEAFGFEPLTTRALMVKHTLAWSKVATPELAPALKSSAEMVPPTYHINGEPDFSAPNGRLAAGRDA